MQMIQPTRPEVRNPDQGLLTDGQIGRVVPTVGGNDKSHWDDHANARVEVPVTPSHLSPVINPSNPSKASIRTPERGLCVDGSWTDWTGSSTSARR